MSTVNRPPSIVLAWAIWTRVCIEHGGGPGLPSHNIPPVSRELAMKYPKLKDLSFEYYRRLDSLSDELVAEDK
jgi:hypothetical protein